MESIPVYKWSNLNHNKLSEYGKQWRIQNNISIESGEMFLSMFRKQILNNFGIGDQDIDKWTISFSLPYPEPILLITDKTGNIRYENGSYFEEH
tara:strand:+ start:4190 stop:4471 length:282 start_codon:yes stop_codon:yes gene_type:complete